MTGAESINIILGTCFEITRTIIRLTNNMSSHYHEAVSARGSARFHSFSIDDFRVNSCPYSDGTQHNQIAPVSEDEGAQDVPIRYALAFGNIPRKRGQTLPGYVSGFLNVGKRIEIVSRGGLRGCHGRTRCLEQKPLYICTVMVDVLPADTVYLTVAAE